MQCTPQSEPELVAIRRISPNDLAEPTTAIAPTSPPTTMRFCVCYPKIESSNLSESIIRFVPRTFCTPAQCYKMGVSEDGVDGWMEYVVHK